jgi:hypothetical protein
MTLTGRPIVPAARSERGAVEGVDSRPIRRPERQMNSRERSIGAVGRIDPKFVGAEVAIAFADRVSEADCCQHGPVENTAAVEVGNPQVHMINQAA